MAERYRIEIDVNGNERRIVLPIRFCGECDWFATDGNISICMREAEKVRRNATSEACGDFTLSSILRRKNEERSGTDDLPQAAEGENRIRGGNTEELGGSSPVGTSEDL